MSSPNDGHFSFYFAQLGEALRFFAPERRENGFRAYGDEHVLLLRKVSALLRHGARIGDLAESIRKGKELPEIQLPRLAPEIQQQVVDLYKALMDFELGRAETLHATLESEHGSERLLELIFEPLLAHMERDRNSGETSHAQESFAATFFGSGSPPI